MQRRYQRGITNLYIEGQTTQWPKEEGQTTQCPKEKGKKDNGLQSNSHKTV